MLMMHKSRFQQLNIKEKDGINQKTGSIFCTTAKWVKGSGAECSGKTPRKAKTHIKQSVFCLKGV